MPTYTFHCSKCEQEFDTYLPMTMGRWRIEDLKNMPKDEAPCPECGIVTSEKVLSADVQFVGTKVTSPEFNPGLGCVVKNKNHKDYLMKSKGVVEVGNDFGSGDKQQRHFEKVKEEENERTWKNIIGEADVK